MRSSFNLPNQKKRDGADEIERGRGKSFSNDIELGEKRKKGKGNGQSAGHGNEPDGLEIDLNAGIIPVTIIEGKGAVGDEKALRGCRYVLKDKKGCRETLNIKKMRE